MPCSVANTFVDENGLLFLPATDAPTGAYVSRTSYDRSMYLNAYFAANSLVIERWRGNRYNRNSVRLVCLAQ